MANIIPDDPKYHQTGSPAEIRVFEALKTLPHDWTVIHSLRWVKSDPTKGYKPQGEGDFICIHPEHGIVVVEVKGGGISYRDGKWFSEDFSGKVHQIQDPEKQASDTKFETLERLRGKGIRSCFVCHCVWFPDVTLSSIDLPMNLSESIVLDMESLNSPLERLLKVFGFWRARISIPKQRLSDAVFEVVKRLLNPSFRLVKTQRMWANDINETYVRLNGEQIEAVEMLTEYRELSIAGRAGSGKTMIGLHVGKREATDDKKVLFLCFNTELAARLSCQNGSSMEVRTIHAFALAYLSEYYPHRILGFSDAPDFDYLMYEFLDVAQNTKLKFDLIVVDEAQDFRSEWINAVKHFLRPDSRLIILYDPYQQLTTSTARPDTDYLKLPSHMELKRNMRNTDPISRACLRIIGSDPADHRFSGVVGREPEVRVVEESDLQKIVSATIHTLLQVEQVSTERISVITLETERTSLVSHLMSGPSMPEFYSAKRFKGLENDFVIIVDGSLAYIEDPVKRRSLYVALSRARAHAFVFLSVDPLYRDYFMKKWKCQPNDIEAVVQRVIRGGD